MLLTLLVLPICGKLLAVQLLVIESKCPMRARSAFIQIENSTPELRASSTAHPLRRGGRRVRPRFMGSLGERHKGGVPGTQLIEVPE